MDLQWYLEMQDRYEKQGYPVKVQSPDITIDRIWGDISSPKAKPYWTQFMRIGLIIGLRVGPPRETWTGARWNRLQDSLDGGPRVVRDK